MAFTTESGLEMKEGSRYWDVWAEPQDHNGSKAVPTFDLYFPSWGLGLTKADRDGNPKVWNKNQVFVEAAESPKATVVSFVIADDKANMQFSTSDELPSFLLAVLPARPGKVIWIIANHVPEGNMKGLAGQGLGGIDGEMAQKLVDFPSGHTLGMCVTGLTTEGGAFMMPFPVQMHWKDISQTTTQSRQA